MLVSTQEKYVNNNSITIINLLQLRSYAEANKYELITIPTSSAITAGITHSSTDMIERCTLQSQVANMTTINLTAKPLKHRKLLEKITLKQPYFMVQVIGQDQQYFGQDQREKGGC